MVAKGRFLASLTGLLKHWISLDWSIAFDPIRYSSTPISPTSVFSSLLPANMEYFLKSPATMLTTSKLLRSLLNIYQYFLHLIDYSLTFNTFLGQLGALGLAAENDHPIIQHHVLALWETVSQLHRSHHFPYGVPPPNEVVYRLLLSPNTMAVDKICGIVGQYVRVHNPVIAGLTLWINLNLGV